MSFCGIPPKQWHEKQQKMNVMLTGIFYPYKACALGETNNANVLKTLNKHNAIIGKWLLNDISFTTAKYLGGKRYWILVVLHRLDVELISERKEWACNHSK